MFVAAEVIPLLRSKVSVKIVDLFSSRKVIATIQESDSIYLFQVRKWHASCGTEIVQDRINIIHNVNNKNRNVDDENENNNNNKIENDDDNENDNENDNSSSDNDIDEINSKNNDNDIDIDNDKKIKINDSKEDGTIIPTLPTNRNEIEVEVEVEVEADIESSSELTSPLSLLSTDGDDVDVFSKLSPLQSRKENENYNEIKNRNRNNYDSHNSPGRGGDEKVINDNISMKNNRILNRQESVDVQNCQEKKGKEISKDKDKDSENLGPVDSSPISSSVPIKMVKKPLFLNLKFSTLFHLIVKYIEIGYNL